jgi:hypothetical protein
MIAGDKSEIIFCVEIYHADLYSGKTDVLDHL